MINNEYKIKYIKSELKESLKTRFFEHLMFVTIIHNIKKTLKKFLIRKKKGKI